jgi:phage terminase large subunit GpA-like protein
MKITHRIQGNDAVRLARCILKASEDGCSIGQCTEAGYNECSGNVYIWDEDWEGAVFMGPGMDAPTWDWTCPNCGEEYTFEFYHELVAFAEEQRIKYDDHCEVCQINDTNEEK